MASEVKQKLTIWVKPRTAEYIRHQSQSKGLTISEAADALLETAFRDDTEVSGAELISVSLKNEMRREFGGLSNRMANLLARAALEGISARYMAYQLLADSRGEEEAKAANRAAWNYAANQLKRPSAQFRELLQEWREGKLEDELETDGAAPR